MAGPKSHKGRREKGARGEREFFTLLNRFLPERLRLKRELAQTREGGSDGSSDHILIEVKRQERLRLNDWLRQAREATLVAPTSVTPTSVPTSVASTSVTTSKIPAVAYRQSNEPWRVVVEMDVVQFAAYMRYQHNIADTVASIRDASNSLP